MSDDALHEALNRNVELREELALTQKAYDAEVEHYRVRMNELEAENARLRAVADVALDLADAACEHDEARLADGWVRLQAAFVAAGLADASEEGT